MNKEEYNTVKDTYKSKRRPDINNRICYNCGSSDTRTSFSHGAPYKMWRRINGEWHCAKCYDKLTITKEQQRRKNANRFKYKGKTVRVDILPEIKTGRCSWCPNNIFDGSCRNTHFHHFSYHDEDPLKNTIELCGSCHAKETRKIVKEDKDISAFEKSRIYLELQELRNKISELEEENKLLKS